MTEKEEFLVTSQILLKTLLGSLRPHFSPTYARIFIGMQFCSDNRELKESTFLIQPVRLPEEFTNIPP
jgi:hypothetical protein